jgi:hypothetical protein
MRNLAKHLPDSSGFDLKHILVEPGKPISLKERFRNSPNSANWEKAWPKLAERPWRFRLFLIGVFFGKARDVGTAADQTS